MQADFSTTAPARLATRLAFFAAGFSMACCAPLFPFFKQAVGADEGQFGLLLLCLGLGSVTAMPAAGVLSARRGARPMVLLGGFGLVAVLPMLAFAGSPLALGAGLFMFGASLGTIDVAMNVHGAEIEEIEKRPLMSNFHAQFSIGALFGAGLVTFFLSVGVSVVQSAVFGACVAFVAMMVSRPRLMSVAGKVPEPMALPRGIVILLAILAGIAFLVEGAVLDWGALLLIERDLAMPENAGLGYIFFSIAMVVARLTGDRIVAGLGEFTVFVLGGSATIIGVATILLAGATWVSMFGFVLIGLGAANLVPIVFSCAGRQTVMPVGLAVASVTTTGYAGILMGPAIIGFIADATSLPTAFWVLTLLMAAFPIAARLVARI